MLDLSEKKLIEYEKGYERVRINMEITTSHQCQNLTGTLY